MIVSQLTVLAGTDKGVGADVLGDFTGEGEEFVDVGGGFDQIERMSARSSWLLFVSDGLSSEGLFRAFFSLKTSAEQL